MVFSQIHEIVFHGKGGYDWHTVYNMPIWLRRYTFEKLKKFYEPEEEDVEESFDKVKEAAKIQPPSYVTKAAMKKQ